MYSIVASPLIIIFAMLLLPGKNESVIENANLAFILVITQLHCILPKKNFNIMVNHITLTS